MPVLLQIDFTFPLEMMGEALTQDAQQLAHSITQEPGFISKIWTENAETGEAGGIYIFRDAKSAQQYVIPNRLNIRSVLSNFDCKVILLDQRQQ